MCFTPVVSLMTAIVEFIIVVYLFFKVKDERLNPLIFFVFALGFYQFTEFMLCRSTNEVLWARIGFATYTMMPILLYHVFVNLSHHRPNLYYYLIPIFFVLMAFFYPNFITYTSCLLTHVRVESLVFNQNLFLMSIYFGYYFLVPFIGVYLFVKSLKLKKLDYKLEFTFATTPIAVIGALIYFLYGSLSQVRQDFTWIYASLIIVFSLLILVVLAVAFKTKNVKYSLFVDVVILFTACLVIFILYFLIPSLTYEYSSIFCQFALLYAVASIFLVDAVNGVVPE